MDPYYKTWHASGYNMIIYMHTDGGSIVSTQRNYPIKKGGLCFIGANRFHYTLPDDPETYDRSKIFLPSDVLDQLLLLFPEDLQMRTVFEPNALVYTQLEVDDQQHVEQILDTICRYQNDSHYLDPIVKSGYISLLVCLRKNKKAITAVTSDMIQNAVEYINQHIYENICIDQICRDIHISKYHFCRKFKKVTGFTVMEYVLKTRIVAGKTLLSDTDLLISEISGRCGFSSVSYFCRVFKEHTGISPLQYRRNPTAV
jgi:AraC-like DNA-binding protein